MRVNAGSRAHHWRNHAKYARVQNPSPLPVKLPHPVIVSYLGRRMPPEARCFSSCPHPELLQ